ncbi:MAG: GNAT family N-acetyltransferase [Aliidiomarina sp.]|uniref:GNAT family N-acetyltransferase n=1 Tax=Aliidiomarina sp. TaxID=1872439 RepID=UPI0025C28659|nr:GNAT family N-acetyltransferase [Aliidiomarina sp.]MCH8502119.1 GNAT family N-acetyltransferase [Aliidiomarina sp.]
MTIAADRQLIIRQTDAPFCQRPDLGFDSLNLAHCLSLNSTQIAHYRHYLGREFAWVELDCRDSFHANAIAALAGTLIAGGTLVIWLTSSITPAMQRFLTIAKQIYPAYRLFHDGAPRAIATRPFQLTDDQTQALNALNQGLEQPQAAAVILAPRGRGKSTVLGLWMKSAPATSSFVLCAPSRKQAQSVFQYLDQRSIKFIAPDQLLTVKLDPSTWLVIDEAASVPAHVLLNVALKHPRLVLSSTTEGYESAGRGFLFRFLKQLPDHYSSINSINLRQPVRWSSADSLEKVINRSFCLTTTEYTYVAKQSNSPAFELDDDDPSIDYQFCHASALEPEVIEAAFQLLMAAHYQTSPNDLKLLLDDAKQKLLIQFYQDQVVGVCWLCEEGPLPQSIHHAILQGKRRPPGALLPQALAFGLRVESALMSACVRIVRITIGDALQDLGLGSRLLQQIKLHYPNHLRGTSFGLNADLHRFWQRNNYLPVRMGNHIDSAAGLPAGLYVDASGVQNRALQAELDQARTIFWYSLQHALVFQTLPTLQAELIAQVPPPSEFYWDELMPIVEQRLQAFVHGWTPFDYIQALLAALLHIRPQVIPSKHFELLSKACQTDLAALAKTTGFQGKKELEAELRIICRDLNLKI